MKLAFTTLGCPDWDFKQILEEAERLGYSAIEIRGLEGEMRTDNISYFFPENSEETKKKLVQHNLEICCFGTSVSFHDIEKTAQMLEEGKAAIDVCVTMNVPFIRVFGDLISSESNREAIIKQVISGLIELCTYAKGKNVKVLLEIHGDFNSIEIIGEVISGLQNFKEFGILWDIEPSYIIYGDDFKPFYELIKPFLCHTHIKDCVIEESKTIEICLVGDGTIPIRKIVNMLIEDGYNGYYSFEWEKKWHPSLPNPEISFPTYANYMKTHFANT